MPKVGLKMAIQFLMTNLTGFGMIKAQMKHKNLWKKLLTFLAAV